MNPEDLARYKEKLEALAAQIRSEVASGSAADDSIVFDNAIGRLTRMEAIQAQAMADAGRRRQAERLPRIAGALQRIAEGTYGACTRCGEAIPEGRLEAMPEAALCARCSARA